MNTELKTAEQAQNQVPTTVVQSPSERFTNAVMKNFASGNGEILVTAFQRKLIQNYFIKIDQVLKSNEKKRLAKNEQYRDPISFTWDNVRMPELAIDVIAFSSVELDPTQPNHLNIIPFKNTANNKYDMAFIIGYRGMELKAKKYGLEVPNDFVIEPIYSTDLFKQFKKDRSNEFETYSFEIINNFDRGEIVGGFWYHEFKNAPEKNKLRVFSMKDIEKRKPKHAAAEFWGGEKDVWEYDKEKGKNVIVGQEKVEGWLEEMVYKTLSRSTYNAITVDGKKIDDNYVTIIEKENVISDSKIQNEIEANANKEPIDFDEYENVEDKTLELPENNTTHLQILQPEQVANPVLFETPESSEAEGPKF